VPRLSYVPNELIMPRKKYSAAYDEAHAAAANTSHLCLVSADEVTAPERTILVGEFSQSPNGILGKSAGGGTAYKSHRPTNAVYVSTYTGEFGDTNCFDGEQWGFYMGAGTTVTTYMLTYDQAESEIQTVLNSPAAGQSGLYSHIAYINDNAHRTGSNYLFVDGHVAKYSLDKTLDPRNWMWGDKIYSCIEKPKLQEPTGSGQLGAP
jgi:prepilin-type processing-associated H-X9-DG protein